MRTYMLPNGWFTDKALVYSQQWGELGELIAKEFGFTLGGYDPGFLFTRQDGTTVDLPTDIALSIRDLIHERNRYKTELESNC